MPGYFIPTDKAIAEKAKEMITVVLSIVYSQGGLAAECGVTPYSLKRIFKKTYQHSIGEFSLLVRMNQAKELWVTTNNS
jgi:AraC-like DNA-binding protein